MSNFLLRVHEAPVARIPGPYRRCTGRLIHPGWHIIKSHSGRFAMHFPAVVTQNFKTLLVYYHSLLHF